MLRVTISIGLSDSPTITNPTAPTHREMSFVDAATGKPQRFNMAASRETEIHTENSSLD